MVARPTDERVPEALGTSVKRRGLFAAAWAAVAAIVLKQTTQPAEAASIAITGNTDPTAQSQPFTSSPVFIGAQTNLPASLFGNMILDVRALSEANSATDGIQVRVLGGTAIFGQSSGNPGVFGTIPNTSNSNTIAMYGFNNSSYTGPSQGAGGFGVLGHSAKGHGLVGATAAAGASAVVGATNGVAGAYAGVFYGPLVVSGAFTVVGGPKSAAVPHPDGSHRLLYCMESPDSWFEDFGKGQLDCGHAEVTLDPDFAAVVNMDDYHVFLTQYDHHNDLCVTRQTPTGFQVQATNGASDGRFSWRVVAKRKDISSQRLAKITLPEEPRIPLPPTIQVAKMQKGD
jgi:hypothetical protein